MKSRKSLSTILRTAGEHGIENQRHDGAMPAGHNGPYHDPETPVRNTAHWLFLFADLYNKTGAEKMEDWSK